MVPAPITKLLFSSQPIWGQPLRSLDPKDKSSGPRAQNSNNNREHSITLLELSNSLLMNHAVRTPLTASESVFPFTTHAHQVYPSCPFYTKKTPFLIFIRMWYFNKYLKILYFNKYLRFIKILLFNKYLGFIKIILFNKISWFY